MCVCDFASKTTTTTTTTEPTNCLAEAAPRLRTLRTFVGSAGHQPSRCSPSNSSGQGETPTLLGLPEFLPGRFRLLQFLLRLLLPLLVLLLKRLRIHRISVGQPACSSCALRSPDPSVSWHLLLFAGRCWTAKAQGGSPWRNVELPQELLVNEKPQWSGT